MPAVQCWDTAGRDFWPLLRLLSDASPGSWQQQHAQLEQASSEGGGALPAPGQSDHSCPFCFPSSATCVPPQPQNLQRKILLLQLP